MGKKEKKYDRKVDLLALNQEIAQESLNQEQENKNMSKEKPTENKAEEQKNPTPETVKDAENWFKPIEANFDPGEIADNFSPENQGFFSKMSEKGKNLAGKFYEGLYKIPGVNKIVGKMEIAYNQFWADKHEAKAIDLKGRMDAVDLGNGALDQSKKEIESVIENLKQQRMPGVESLQLKLRDIDEKKTDLQNKKDKIQSKFEYRDNKKKLYTNERDRVADKLIGRYNEKLEPMEKELEKLQDSKNRMDLQIATTEIKHKESMTKLADMENNKTVVENALKATGMSDRQVRNFEAVKVLETLLADGREKIRMEKEELTRRKAEINQKIAKVDAKANPYRDKRGEFTRVKERRPIEMKVEARKREDFEGEEDVKGTTREKFEAESGKEEQQELQAYISGWNVFIQEKYGKGGISGELIDGDRFSKETGLSKDTKIDFGDFKNVLAKYYKVAKLPKDKFDKSIDEFFDKKVKVENNN